MDPPPPYKVQASMTRSRTSRDNVQEMADAMLRNAMTRNQSANTATAAAASRPVSSDTSSLSRQSSASGPQSVITPTQSNPSIPVSPISAVELSASASSSRFPPPQNIAASSPPTSPNPIITVSSSAQSSAERSPVERRKSIPTTPQYLPIMGSAFSKNKKAAVSSDKLKSVEQENEELRRQVEQLKREANRSSYVSNKEAKQRVAQLKDEAKLAVAEAKSSLKPNSNAGLFKTACSTDLLFLIDCTNSMRKSIDTVKSNVKKIVANITKTFYNEAQIRVAVVGYRDHGAKVNIEAFDFTTSTDQVEKFLDSLQTYYGHDIPEDVLGGLNKALNMSWDQPNRCIIHIGDAPPHARILQDEPYQWDRYPEIGSEPHGLTYEPILQLMTRKNINYAFLPIHEQTDRMAFLFAQVYLSAFADVKLNTANRYYAELNELKRQQSIAEISMSSKKTAEGRLMFAVADMGTIYTYLHDLVVKCVLSSATRTASRAAASMVGVLKDAEKMGLSPLSELTDSDFELDQPQWTDASWFDEQIPTEGFSPDVVLHSSTTLDNMMANDENIKMSTTDLTILKRRRPFAQGALRVACYGRTAHSTGPFVVKSFKYKSKQLAHLVEEMRCQALCKAFALEFNGLVSKSYAIDFVVTASLKGKLEKDERLSLEPFIEGDYVKYNNNCGYVNDEIPADLTNQAAQAFSHFTFERSQGRFLISDLQGVGNLFTDPAVHTRDEDRFALADTNLGKDGFKFFFATHTCNAVCRTLQLKSTAEMLLNNSFTFRQTWPTTSSTVCCSNKFCGKIVDLKSANKALVYPGFFWCNQCWPHIDRTKLRQACIAQGPHHTFEVSAFFFESQGRMTPRTCVSHRTRDEAVRPPSMTENSGGFLKKLGFGRK